ncbi:MAG: hydantoinase/oxoprolinase family protein [Alphaproteobacteria bacterium]|nr:hydantoinase/oxoprolinase family protein [Alphaproteobacteria bacterium]
MRYLATDVGGTFTDMVLVDGVTGQFFVDKVPSGARGAAAPIAVGIQQILEQAGLQADEIDLFVHGFTVSTNALLTGAGAKAALITTKGFRDVLEIRNQLRPKLYSVTTPRIDPVIPRNRVFEVDERVDAFGAVVTDLNDSDMDKVVEAVAATKPEAIAICLTFAHLNPDHEVRLAAALKARLPDTPVYLSHKINPQIEEWPRANTTSIAAYVGPIVDRYLTQLEQTLDEEHLTAPLRIMRSDGGVATPPSSRTNPAHTLLSGPAGGVVAASQLAKDLDIANAITFDMGGTSADFAAIVGAEARMVDNRVISGHPLRLPSLDVETISAGGGSIAWIDMGGALRVGPQSAGSVPGPACYPNGGDAPTVTDAAVVMGLLDPNFYLGGRISLSADRARNAIMAKLADPLGVSVEDAAYGIVRIATAGMAQAIRTLCVERGVDPRRLWLMGFGGAGPLFSGFLAQALDMRGVIVPAHPGVFAAEGLLMSDIRHSAQTPVKGLVTDPAKITAFAEAAKRLRDETNNMLAQDGITADRRSFRCFAGLRYVGQYHELSVEIAPETLSLWSAETVLAQFHAQHQQVYGHADPDSPVEFVSLQIDSMGRIDRPSLMDDDQQITVPNTTGTRPVMFDTSQGFIDTPVIDRASLVLGEQVHGPAIITQLDSTVVVAPGETAQVAVRRTLLIDRKGTK